MLSAGAPTECVCARLTDEVPGDADPVPDGMLVTADDVVNVRSYITVVVALGVPVGEFALKYAW